MTTPDFMMYPDEELKVAELLIKLGNQFEFAEGKYGPDGPDRRIFEAAAEGEFSRAGIKVRVNWEEQRGLNGTTVWRPGIEPYGRTRDDSETDHDRFQWGVVKGLGVDDQAGYVREDGSRREDPIKKNIY